MTQARQFFYLLASRRFLPLFLTQFLGAFNDNLFKNALILWIGFKMPHEAAVNSAALITLAAGIFMLPFFLFSPTAGELADKYDKAIIARWVKRAEIALMTLGCVGFLTGSLPLLLLVLFGMGAHSTFFGPVKYAILPDHLKENELIQGNALIEGGTFLAILLGTIMGGVLILQERGAWETGLAIITIAVTGFLTSRFIPPAAPPAPRLRLSRNILTAIWGLVRDTAKRPPVFRAVLGISWFWLVGATFLSILTPYVRDILHAEPHLVTFLLAMFSVGIAAGSMLCYALLGGRITSALAPWGALGMAIAGLDLVFASQAWIASGTIEVESIAMFLHRAAGLRIAADLFMVATAGGIYAVPFYALMQARAEESHRARVVAANNVLNALFMVVATAGLTGLFARGTGLLDILSGLAILNALVAVDRANDIEISD